MSEEKLKVTDRRMFTPDGELREEFRHLDDAPARPETASGEAEVAATEDVEPADAGGAVEEAKERPREEAADEPVAQGGEVPPTDAEAPGPEAFSELVAMLAEPAALYLGDAQLPDGRSMEDPRMARLHIDLLATLQAKTEGNLEPAESALLENVLYQLRVRFLQKHGSR